MWSTIKRIIFIVIILGAFAVGIYVGYAKKPVAEKIIGLDNMNNDITQKVDFNSFWKAWNLIEENYVPPDISSTSPEKSTHFKQDMVWGAISGLASSLKDPHTVFLPPKENEVFQTNLQGNFEGVGMQIDIVEGILTVVAPLKGTPAEEAGIKSGDRIISIDGESTQGIIIEDAVNKIRGPKGSEVVLSVVREGLRSPIEISITRGIITLPIIDTYIHEQNEERVFVIELYNFNGPATNEFSKALREFALESDTNKLLLDLRANPGGLLTAAVNISDWFLPKGSVILREYFGEDEDEIVWTAQNESLFNDNLRMVILIDGGSASASEIVAGALSEHGVATLIGRKSFGKGSVQELFEVTDDTSIKITIARWLTPDGTSISGGGLTPDIIVDYDINELEEDEDPIFDRGIEYLLEMN